MRRINNSAGQYRSRAVIKRLKSTATVNAAGHIVEPTAANWEQFASRWCAVESVVGRETLDGARSATLSGMQLTESATHMLRFRSDSVSRNFTTKMRAHIGSRIFNFAAPPLDADERRVEVFVPAIEIK